MANATISKLVGQAVQQWLYERRELMQSIMDEVAEEIGPLVATQVLTQLQAVILETTQQQLLHDLAAGCKRALDLVEALDAEDDDVEVPAYEPIRQELIRLMQQYTTIFGPECLTNRQTRPSGQSPFSDLPGGDV
jgi:hypothetical protein